MNEGKLFILQDEKSETFTAPTYHTATGQALRSFSDAVNGEKYTSQGAPNMLAQHPADFTLFEIGTYNQSTGELILHEARKVVANGLDVLDPQLDV
jgi:hypothetical protein